MTGPRNATTTNRGRTYRWNDEEFVSVTTIISGGVPKPALPNWAARSVAEFVAENLDQVQAIASKDTAAAIDLMKGSPWRQRDAAANLGSEIHAAAEAWILGKPLPEWPEKVAPYMRGFLRFLDDFKPTYELAEASVYNREWHYAGTLDAILSIEHRVLEEHGCPWHLDDDRPVRLLVDYKTGKGVYGEVALQLAAYRRAEFVGMPDDTEAPMPAVDGAAVLHLVPDGYELIPVRAGEMAYRFFLYAQQIRDFCESYGKTMALGQPIVPAPAAAPVVEAVAS